LAVILKNTMKKSTLKFDFYSLKEGESVIDAYQVLSEIPVLKDTKGLPDDVDNELLIRYYILMYCKGSFAIENYPHEGKRKTWILRELGILPHGVNEPSAGWNEVLMNQNRSALQKAAVILTLESPQAWGTMLKASEELYMLNTLPFPTDDREANERIKRVNGLNTLIEESKKTVLEFDKSVLLESALTEFKAYTTLGLRPEERVMDMRKSVKPHETKADMIFKEVRN
jgi:hypothetical protein